MDDLVEMLLGMFVILSILAVLAFIHDATKGRKLRDELIEALETKKKEIDDSICQLAAEMLGTSDGVITKLLDNIHSKATERAIAAKQEYINEHGIESTQETYSELGLCGVSSADFVCNLESFNNSSVPVLARGSVSQEYVELEKEVNKSLNWMKSGMGLRGIPDDILSTVVQAIKDYQKVQVGLTAKKIQLENIDYFKEEGTVQYVSDVSGGGVNIKGAVAGAVLAGDAAAIIGSRVGTETKTTINTIDKRHIILVYRENNSVKSMDIKSSDPEKTMNALRALIPQKEYTVVSLNKQESAEKAMPAQLSSADELKKFKGLLDEGIITQEEFDAKKKQLLGL